MINPSSDVYGRVGLVPVDRLRWLLDFGNLDPAKADAEKRTSAWVEEARAFLVIQQTESPIRGLLRLSPAPRDDTPNAMSEADVLSAQDWLRRGLDALCGEKIWSFAPHVQYELDMRRGLFWARLRADSRLELFKALVYDALRDARFSLRFCLECRRPFVLTRRQAYCSPRCSQAVRTRKWRKAHPEKNREIRRNQYQRSIKDKLGVSPAANIKVGRSRQRPAK